MSSRGPIDPFAGLRANPEKTPVRRSCRSLGFARSQGSGLTPKNPRLATVPGSAGEAGKTGDSRVCPFAGLRANPHETPGFDRTPTPVLLLTKAK
jgi:hypothetical protein